MLLRRLLGIVVLSFAVVFPVAGQEKDKAKDDKKETKKDDKKEEKKEDKKGEKVLLKWKLEKGKDFYQKMYTKTKQTMTVTNNKVEQTQEQTFFFKWTVVDNKGDDWTLKQKIEGVIMNIDIGNQKIQYDSTKEKEAGNNPLSEFFKALKDSEFTITLNTAKMEVTDIKGRDEFIQKLGKQNPQMEPLLKEILSEKALKQMAEPTFAAIPGKEVAIGDKWTRKTSLDMGPIGKYENEYTYTLEGPESKDSKVQKIKVETSLKYLAPTDAGGGTGTGGLPFKIKSATLTSTKADGQILFNTETGRIEKSTMNLALKGDLKIEIGGQSTDVNLEQTQDSTVENQDKPFIEPKK